MPRRRVRSAVVAVALLLGACGSTADDASEATAPTPASDAGTVIHDVSELRDSDVPDLPFPDNPDPRQCGIPTPWGEGGQAWLTGIWEGDLIQPEVLLYDSHQRLNITGEGEHGAEVTIVLFQSNPVLDYYMVDVVGQPGESGWVPAPFLSFDPVV